MDPVRVQRLLNDLHRDLIEAREACGAFTDEQWEAMETAGIAGACAARERLSRLAPEFRQLDAAVKQLYPHLVAWSHICPYRAEIMDASDAEQQGILEQVIEVLQSSTRMPELEIRNHIYAFWPVCMHNTDIDE